MKRSFFRVLLYSLLLCTLLSVGVHADIGPKPSVRVTFENLSPGACWATLLSKSESTGPSSVWNGNAASANHNGNPNFSWSNLDEAVWQAFVDYADQDGYHFLQEGWQVDETGELAWTYYPPRDFKILLYYPGSDTFVTSGVLTRYAFDSYFTADAASSPMVVSKSYAYGWEIVSLLARILATLALEFGIAYLFGFRGKREFLFLGILNAATQIGLNLTLNVINYNAGQMAFVIFYVLLELLIFALEAFLCSRFRKKWARKERPVWFYTLYALLANAASFGAGLWLANVIPGIF